MKKLFFFLLLLCPVAVFAQKGSYLTVEEFHQKVFPNQDLKWRTLWVNNDLRSEIETIIDRRFSNIRVRYWGNESKTAWIFEEIGKELPITVGVVVDTDAIDQIQIMEYRESRGGEVRYPFFTSQFNDIRLKKKKSNWKLDKHIDGITGATLSVRALKKIATLALFCHQQTEFAQLASE